MITITIREFGTDRTWESTHRTDDVHTAVRRALTKHFGRRSGWWADSGLGPRYGQVTMPAGCACRQTVTNRCRMDVDGAQARS